MSVLACSDPTDRERVIGTINADGERTATVVVPSEAAREQPFEITVYTFGSSTCTRPDGTDLTVTGLLARIVPYDEVPTANTTACSRDLAQFPHTLRVQFDTDGLATLRLVGQFGQGEARVLDSVELSLLVRP